MYFRYLNFNYIKILLSFSIFKIINYNKVKLYKVSNNLFKIKIFLKKESEKCLKNKII